MHSETRADGTRNRNSTTEPCVVETAKLAPYVNAFIEEHEKEHPSNRSWTFSNRRPRETRHMGAVNYLLQEMVGIDNMPSDLRDTRSMAEYGQIRRVRKLETKYTALSIADALLTAMGRPDLLGNEIPVIPNPHWSMERYVAYMEERGCI